MMHVCWLVGAVPLLLLGIAQGKPPPAPPPVLELVEDDVEPLLRQLQNDGNLAAGKDNSKIGRELRDVYSGVCSVRATDFQRFTFRVQGWTFPIVQNPQPGQFRYLRFAWKRTESPGIMIQLHASGRWDQRYYAGQVTPLVKTWGAMIRVAEHVPRDWEQVTRDLFQDFGAITITGIAFTPMEGAGAGFFDHIYLGRSIKDLDQATDVAFGKHPLNEALSAPELEKLWTELADTDIRRAGRAVRTLTAGRKEGVPFLKKRLERKPEPSDAKRIARLISALDDEDFGVREEASDDLNRVGPASIKLLQAARASTKSAEQRQRIDVLLRNHLPDDSGLTSEQMRILRAVRVLEWSGTADAQQVLEGLARLELDAGLNQDVKNALGRLARQRK
jgi:hypothetical protein